MTIRVLPVPYLIQPTPITCQSTCLKMFGMYLESRLAMSSPGPNQSIQEIWAEINTGTARPVKARNAYANMSWWLERYFAPERFHVIATSSVDVAATQVVAKLDNGWPIMVSTNHDRTKGHIILVIGYQSDGLVSGEVHFICHDPYGKFDPQLSSKQYGKRRFDGAASLPNSGEDGPGNAVLYDYQGIQRIREDRHSAGKFFLITTRS